MSRRAEQQRASASAQLFAVMMLVTASAIVLAIVVGSLVGAS